MNLDADGGEAFESARRPSDRLIGRSLGEFVVREKLGEGGFGAVFRAEQPLLEREAVIKVLQSRGRVSESTVQRFLQEARLASSLDHPYAAHIYAFGAENDGLLWIAMELVRGTPLDKLLKAQGPIPLPRFVPLFDRICEVVHTAHEQGIIHRDLKPANVMVLSRAGRLLPKLLDLGVAKLRQDSLEENRLVAAVPESDGSVKASSEDNQYPRDWSTLGENSGPRTRPADLQLTERGRFVGSPHYMAPEQWVNPGAADQRSDIYALGVLCYEALTGRRPFEGETVLAIARSHAQSPMPPLGPELPEALLPVLQRAVAKKSAERFSTALELAGSFRVAAGIGSEPDQIPQLEEAVRETVIAAGPQPLAEAVAALEAVRSTAQALEAVAQVFRVGARYLGLLALACRSQVGPGASRDSEAALELLALLRRQSLSDEGWINLARELCRPFSRFRDAYPIPELVSFFFEAIGDRESANSRFFQNVDTAEAPSGDEGQRQLLASELARLEQLLRSTSFLSEYALVVTQEQGAESWTGVRRNRRTSRGLRGKRLRAGQPLLVDQSGAPVVCLWPLIQAMAPTPGASEELFLLDGQGRHGAKLVAMPLGFERHDEAVWDWFRQHIVDLSTDGGRGVSEERAPYLGLASFTADDAQYFFGREREAEAFANRMRVLPLSAVVGPSGAGKSSFIQAGVIPLLPSSWRVITVRPGSSPLSTLVTGLSQELPSPPDALGQSRDPARIADSLHAWAHANAATLVLVIDQFEELLTLCPDPSERELFAQVLVQAARSADDPIRVVLTLRDDFLIRTQQIGALRERLAQGLQLLGTPAPDDLRRILLEPARQAGYEFEDPRLLDEMVEQVADQPGALALLSFTASKLWDLRDRHFCHLSRGAYYSLGGVGGALGQHAESTLAQLPPEQQKLVREAFRHLVTADRTRAVLTRREMEQLLGGGAPAQNVLERLITARLLITSEEQGAEDRIEVIHEALLTSWPRLVEWQQEDAENARMRHQLRAAARQWDERGRGKGLLWRREALMEYRLWRSRYAGRLTDTEEAFAAASLAEEARGRLVRRLLVGGAFVLLSSGLVVLYRANNIAVERAAEARRLLAMSHEEQGRQLLLAGDPVRAIVYLDKAYQEGASGPALQFMLGRATRALDAQVAVLPHKDWVREAHFSPDGQRAVTASYDRTAKVWDAATGKLLAVLEGATDRVLSARFSPDGSRVITASIDGSARVYDLAGRMIRSLEVGPSATEAEAAFNPDGSLIAATVGTRGRIWEAASYELLGELNRQTGAIQQFQFHPNGRSIFAASKDGTVTRWDAHGRLLISIEASDSPSSFRRTIASLSLSADGKRLATAGYDRMIKVWDTDSGKELSKAYDPGSVFTWVAMHPNGTQFVALNYSKVGKIRDSSSGEVVRFLEGHTGRLRSATYNADGTQLLTTSDDGSAKLWKSSGDAALLTLIGHLDTVNSGDFSPDGAHIITPSQDGTARVWDTRQGPRLTTFSEAIPVAFGAWSSDGQRVLLANVRGEVKLWQVDPVHLIRELHVETDDYHLGAWSPDETRLAIDRENDSTRLFDFPSGRAIATLQGHVGRVHALTFSPDSTLLATGGADRSVKVWAAKDGALLLSLDGHSDAVRSIAFDAQGKRLISGGSDKKVHVWDLASAARLLTLDTFQGDVYSVDFSNDGSRFVTASRDHRLAIWDATTGRLVLSLQEAKWSNINSAHFNPEGTLLITGDTTGYASVWDVRTGRLLSTFFQAASTMVNARFSPDNRRGLTDVGNEIVLWDVRLDTRGSGELSAYVRCRVPFRLEAENLVQAPTDAWACRP